MSSEEKSRPSATPRGKAAREAREKRLAQALRANLGRRKAQARSRAEPETGKPPDRDRPC